MRGDISRTHGAVKRHSAICHSAIDRIWNALHFSIFSSETAEVIHAFSGPLVCAATPRARRSPDMLTVERVRLPAAAPAATTTAA